MKKIYCSSCKRQITHFIECWKSSIEFDLEEDKINSNQQPDGHPYKVQAVCDCGKKWRLRKVKQITDVLWEEKNDYIEEKND